MKSILSTCVLFLVLAWKLSDGTTIRPIRNRHETTPRAAEYIISSATITEESLKPLSNGLEKSTSKYQETTPSGNKPIFLSTKNRKDPLKPSGGTTFSLSSTGLDNASTRGDEPTTFFTKNQEEHTTEKSKNVLSSKLSPQTTTMTSMSHAEHLVTAKTMSRGESRSDSLQSSSPLTELMQKQTDLTIFTTQNMLKEVMTTRDERLALHSFKSTNKGLERHTRSTITTGSEDESFKTKTAISSNIQTPPEVITDQSVHTTETLTTTRSSLPRELESSHQPTLNIIVSNGTSNEERNDTATYPLNTSTNTRFSTGLGPTVNKEDATTVTTETMKEKATDEIPTKPIIRKEMNPTSKSKTSVTNFRDTTKSTKSTTIKDKNNKKSNPGPIVASLIGSSIFLMFIAFVVVWVRNHQKKQKQTDNPDWAGPSPFIEADIQPNLPTVNEDGPFQRHELKRISLHSFLPQQLSKRLSILSLVDEEVPLGSRTFGQYNAHPLNVNASADQIQTPEANSPPAELSSNSDVPDKADILQAPENKETVQTNTKPDDEITPSPPTETNNDTSTPFEDVALNPSLEQNTETTSPSDDTNMPSPPPITTS